MITISGDQTMLYPSRQTLFQAVQELGDNGVNRTFWSRIRSELGLGSFHRLWQFSQVFAPYQMPFLLPHAKDFTLVPIGLAGILYGDQWKSTF